MNERLSLASPQRQALALDSALLEHGARQPTNLVCSKCNLPNEVLRTHTGRGANQATAASRACAFRCENQTCGGRTIQQSALRR